MCVAPHCIIVDVFQPDAEYFKVDLPNSGEVVLSKPLDYETKTLLTVTIHASVSYMHTNINYKFSFDTSNKKTTTFHYLRK